MWSLNFLPIVQRLQIRAKSTVTRGLNSLEGHACTWLSRQLIEAEQQLHPLLRQALHTTLSKSLLFCFDTEPLSDRGYMLYV